ncbi:MAG: hypothetical protein Q8Q85_14600 [Gemmatimonadales bacterium]|nr:hypothetical protein [Gemmatimonadales bacterium]
MFKHDPKDVVPVSDVLIARPPLPGSKRRNIEEYVPERDADAVTGFAYWKIPRGWLVVCLTEESTYDHPERDIWGLRELYLLKRKPDVKGSIHLRKWGFLEFRAIWKTRGRYAANAQDIRRILRAILAD